MERLGRIDMLLELLDNEPEDLFLNYALGIEYVSAATVVEAEEQFRKVLGLNQNYVAAYYQLGKLYEAKNNHVEALQFYKAGLIKAKLLKDKSLHEFEEAIFMLED